MNVRSIIDACAGSRCPKRLPRRDRRCDPSTWPRARARGFLDRDGTIIEDVGYLHAFDQIAFFPWSADAIRSLNRAGLPVVVITNQAGIARGLFTEQFVIDTHVRVTERLAEGGAHGPQF